MIINYEVEKPCLPVTPRLDSVGHRKHSGLGSSVLVVDRNVIMGSTSILRWVEGRCIAVG